MIKVNVVFYSMYGHIYHMAQAVHEGVQEVAGVEAGLFQVPEHLPDEILEKFGAKAAKQAFANVPVATMDTLAEAQGIIFGTPTRFGNMAGQMRNFLDQTGLLWMKGALVGKPGSVFSSSGTQHGGQETTITSFHTTLLHHGMVIVGGPIFAPEMNRSDEVSGGTPYGATTIAAQNGSRQPSENELKIARAQGKYVAEITKKLFR